MQRTVHSLRRLLLGCAIVIGLLAVPAPGLAEPETATVSGTVSYDGEGLAGVEVFLFVFGEGPRYTCTDADGDFEFADVPTETGLISATGPEVGLSLHVPAGPCANPKFFDGAWPLAVVFWDDNRLPPFDVFDASIGDGLDYEVGLVPNQGSLHGIVAHARNAMNACYDQGDAEKAVDRLDKYVEMIDNAVAAGTLDPATEAILRDYGDAVRPILDPDDPFHDGCPPGS